jgi:hypothetical protein
VSDAPFVFGGEVKLRGVGLSGFIWMGFKKTASIKLLSGTLRNLRFHLIEVVIILLFIESW